MPSQGVRSRLSLRVLDPDTGAVVVPQLPHFGSSWTVRALQPGSSSATLGGGRILIPAPSQPEHRRRRGDLLSLAHYQKVEASGGTEADASPRFTGVITGLTRNTDGPWELEVTDSLWWLQRAFTFPGEVFAGQTTADAMVDVLRATPEMVWNDDFSGGTTGYSVTGWSATSSDPYAALPALVTTTTLSTATTTTTWLSGSEYNLDAGGFPSAFGKAAAVTLKGTLVAGTDTTTAGTAELLVLSDSSWANGYMLRIISRQTGVGTGLYNVDAEIWSATGAVATRQALVSNVMTNISAIVEFELTAVLYTVGSTHYLKLLVNGSEPSGGCTYSGFTPPASGAIGARTTFNAGGSPALYVNSIVFQSRPGGLSSTWGTPRFARGTFVAGSTAQQNIVSTGQSQLDLMQLAMNQDGYYVRKTPAAGYKSDLIDYLDAASLPNRTAQVVFAERRNIVRATYTQSAEPVATATRTNGLPGTDSFGTVNWGPKRQNGSQVIGDVTAFGAPGYSLLSRFSRRVASTKAVPLNALELVILRTPDIADRFRELDQVQAHAPSIGVNHQSYLVAGYTFDEGSAQQTVWLNRVPDYRDPGAGPQRQRQATTFLTNTYKTR